MTYRDDRPSHLHYYYFLPNFQRFPEVAVGIEEKFSGADLS